MIEIIPAIMPKTFEEINEKVSALSGKALSFQVDLMDGKFVEGKTWPFIEKDAKRIDAEFFELDLMVGDASSNIHTWASMGAGRIIFHLEAEKELIKNLEEFKDKLQGIEIGISFDDDHNIEHVEDFIPYADFVQVMGIDHVGKQGEPFEPRVLYNLTYLRKKYPELVLSVDGSVNFDTAKELVLAGANRLVVGSAIFREGDPIKNFEKLQSLVQ